MDDKEKPIEAPEKPSEPDTIDNEDRIDEFAIKAFQAMGYKTRLSDNMVMFYKEFKSRKDRIQPGRLTPEGLTFVAMMAELIDNNLPLED